MTREELIERVNKFQGANREFSQELPPIVEALCDEIDEAGPEVVDSLTSNARDKALSANMGKTLKAQVDSKVEAPEVAGSDGQVLSLQSGEPAWVDAPEGTVIIDSAMSDSSTHAVQNRVITEELDKYAKKDGYYDSLTAGLATNLVDTKGTGTEQELIRRTSCGNESISDDGAGVIQEIKGSTKAINQLVDEDTTEVTIPSGHKYFAIIGGTASVATSDGTAIAVTGGVDEVTDLTLAGFADYTLAQILALYPNGFGAYNAGVLKSNDAAALLTDGFNQWDEQWRNGYYGETTGEYIEGQYVCTKNPIKIMGGQTYYFYCGSSITNMRMYVSYYDAAGNLINTTTWNVVYSGSEFTVPSKAVRMNFWLLSSYGATYANDICINLSWSGYRNGEYEPYWQRVLALRLSELTGIPEGGTEADRVTMFPNGAGGAGSAFDSIFVENGVTKARGTMLAEVDLGDLAWSYSGGLFIATISGRANGANFICSKYVTSAVLNDKTISYNATGESIYVKDSAYTDAATFKAAMAGVKLLAEAATPIVYTDLQYADGTPFTMPKVYQVADFGTETIVQPEGATTPSAPFRAVIKYNDDFTREIVNLPENYDTTDGIDALCSALATALSSALNGTLTITRGNYSESDKRYAFTVTFTPNE